MTAFFDKAENRVAFLTSLASMDREEEAMTLCLAYIDRFAQCLCWPSTSTGRNFVCALMQFGQEPLMAMAHPLQAARALVAAKPQCKALAERIGSAFPGPPYEVLPIPDFEHALAKHVTPDELARLKPYLWQGTIANVVYQHLRTPAIHRFGTGAGIILSQTTYNGQPVSNLGLVELSACLRGLRGW